MPWVSSLDSQLRTAGFEAVESDIRIMPPHLELATQECNLLLPELIIRKAGGDVEKSALLKELLQEVAAEVRGGAFWAWKRYTVIGRKPE